MMYQGVNVEGLEAYRVVSSGKSHARSSVELIVR